MPRTLRIAICLLAAWLAVGLVAFHSGRESADAAAAATVTAAPKPELKPAPSTPIAEQKAALGDDLFQSRLRAVADRFRGLDGWIRMRLRAMKYKRKWATDNWRLRWQHFRRLGFIFLSDALAPPAVEPT